MAECVEGDTQDLGTPVLGHLAQRPTLGSLPCRSPVGVSTTLSLCPREEAAHILEGAS